MKSLIASACAAVALAACGGGGDGGSAATPVLREGLYTGGSFSFWDLTGSPSTVLVLEGGEVWALLGGNPPVFFGQGIFAYASTEPGTTTTTTTTTTNSTPPTSTTNTTSTPNVDVFDQSKALGALRSNVLGELAISIRLREFSSGTTLSVIAPTKPEYEGASGREATVERGFNYNKPARLQDVAGVWGKARDVSSYVGASPLNVDASGAVSAPVQLSGCSLAGTITPRPSGKNVFNLRLSLMGCADAGEYSGVAFTYLDSTDYTGAGFFVSPTFRLIATNSDKTKVFGKTTSR